MLRLTNLQPRSLDPISLELADGECLAVSGISGAGKSTFLRAIADLDVNAGEADASGGPRSQMKANDWRFSVTYLPAESGWWADSVADHLPGHDQCLSLLEDLGLPSDCIHWPIDRLSTGEKQRLALARALLNNPYVLLLDEPTSALDVEATGKVESVLRQRMEAGTTVVIVTHDEAQAKRLKARQAVIHNGCLELEDAATHR